MPAVECLASFGSFFSHRASRLCEASERKVELAVFRRRGEYADTETALKSGRVLWNGA